MIRASDLTASAQGSRILVVGAGFAGSVSARVLAEAGHRVHVVERRDHVGGNAFDTADAAGVLVHRYGPHIFHTDSRRIFDFLSRFTAWRPYEHRVRAVIGDRSYPFPVNLDTLQALYGVDLDERTVEHWLAEVVEPRPASRSFEDAALASVGRDLYEKFFRDYTRKHWGIDPSRLAASVFARVPLRKNRDDRYFVDRYQGMPSDGYTSMFEKMLAHPAIDVDLGTDLSDIPGAGAGSWEGASERLSGEYAAIVYTGPIDAFYGHRFGRLPYRSVRFEHEHLPGVKRFQEVASINYPDARPYTRITEFRHLTGQAHSGTSIVREYPQACGDPYYPVPGPDSEALYKKYRALADREARVVFVGRLAQYRYYNMDQVTGAALVAATRLARRLQRA